MYIPGTVSYSQLDSFVGRAYQICSRFATSTMECEGSGKFGVGQGLHQGCVLTPLMFSMFITGVRHVVEERCCVNANTVKNMVCTKMRDEKGAGRGSEGGRRKGEINPRRLAEPQPTWRMLYGDDAGIFSRSKNNVAKMIADIV